MVFQSSTYSVLLVSASEKLNTAMVSLLPATDFWPITTVHSLSEARRATLENAYDIVVVNAPLPDGNGLSFCADVCADSESGVLLLVRSEIYEEIYYKMLPSGVVTLSRPTSRDVVAQSLRILCAIRERLRSAGKRQATVEEKMEELRLVNRAKWALMQARGMTEDEAHRHIISSAMERRITKREMAERIVAGDFSDRSPSVPGRDSVDGEIHPMSRSGKGSALSLLPPEGHE